MFDNKEMNIRIAHIEDLPRIVEIYNQAILTQHSTADLTPIRTENRMTWFSEHTPERHPVFLAEIGHAVVGWCSLSPYRPGRMALRFTVEISCYVDQAFRRKGVAAALITHAIAECPRLNIKTLYGILLERNRASIAMMRKLGFEQWGYLPRVADFDGEECAHIYFGKRVWDVKQDGVANASQPIRSETNRM
jgi:L-amino acid N-acyltransferase YncA